MIQRPVKKKNLIIYLSLTLFLFYCRPAEYQEDSFSTSLPSNNLDYSGTPSSPKDRSSLAFSDQGAWFAYGIPNTKTKSLGFSGPFLMTQGQGEWSSTALSQLELIKRATKEKLDLNDFSASHTSYNSHLNQVFENNELKLEQSLFFNSPHSAIISTQITNISDKKIVLHPSWNGITFPIGLIIKKEGNTISLTSDRSSAKGVVQTFEDEIDHIITTDSSYSISLNDIELKTHETKILTLGHTFIFSEYDAIKEQK